MNSKRIDLLFLFFLLGAGLFIFRLFQFQILEHKEFQAEVEKIITRVSSIEAPRGRIFDRNGIPLAWNEPIYILKKKVPFLSEKIRSILYTALNRADDATSTIRKLEVFGEVEAHLRADYIHLLEDSDEIDVEEHFVRRYSENPGIAHVVGYITSEEQPVRGIEKFYNDLLTGKNGLKLLKVDNHGKVVSVLEKTEPIPGEDLVLTIDASLSSYAYSLLKSYNRPGAVIVMKTDGQILAMASNPSYSPEQFSLGLSDREWTRLKYDPEGPLLNRAVSPYPPGSIIKPFISMVALSEKVSPDATIFCSGIFQYKDSEGHTLAVFSDWYLYGHKEVDLRRALAVSCNVYFYELGLELGIDTLTHYAELTGIFGKTGIDLEERKGLMPSREWKFKTYGEPWYPGDTILTYIGQGYALMTPLEVTRMTAIIATKGCEVVPYIYRRSATNEKDFHLSEDAWETIIAGMKDVISRAGTSPADRGTAYHAFKGFPYDVAGKTGTAENTGNVPHSWFTGFSPVDDPEIIVTVFVENGGYGSTTAAAIARKIFEAYYGIR
ncbi:penicillin-binding transpeptidase domain-containing protein [Kosmotoga sp.]|uniref:penicillin-binding transpeptidase domain-containing protein n=1 Tax=Kosmotoga sp. TaxID=1955248 RepID=UPI0024ABBB85|nr:penicillin-binding transpeptidase domain-containing protein [Kosmotoga sp.]MDI3524099.1 penicillin-binding protein 2 [Kosmotoga sp.]